MPFFHKKEFTLKLILSDTEVDAIIYCSSTLAEERCIVSILHIGEKSELANALCLAAFSEQRLWEIHRAYKDFGKEHIIEYLKFPEDNYHYQLSAYLQIKHMLGGFSDIIYQSKFDRICKSLKGNIKLIPYEHQQLPPDIRNLQRKSLSRFKSVKPNSEYNL
jgi:hypothetical protein